jgi:hypothetical protein
MGSIHISPTFPNTYKLHYHTIQCTTTQFLWKCYCAISQMDQYIIYPSVHHTKSNTHHLITMALTFSCSTLSLFHYLIWINFFTVHRSLVWVLHYPLRFQPSCSLVDVFICSLWLYSFVWLHNHEPPSYTTKYLSLTHKLICEHT